MARTLTSLFGNDVVANRRAQSTDVMRFVVLFYGH